MSTREPALFISNGPIEREAVSYLNNLFLRAVESHASDIHIQWNEGAISIFFRQSGELAHIESIDEAIGRLIDEKIRSRANISQAERNKPLDGRMRLRYEHLALDVRLSIVPSVGGQKMVMRLLDQRNAAKDLDSIEMTPMVRASLGDIMDEPEGMFLLVGPTGSGKTTTLYAILRELHNGKRNILTLENPVEYVVPGLTQINIDQHMTFAAGLRAALRQDPDVILVGEIRDNETAQIAIQAANTGHLVLATLHANSAAMAITRLLDMGVEAHSVAESLRGVMSQRLAKRLTIESEPEWTEPSELETLWLIKHNMLTVSDRFPRVSSEGQFRGRIPIIEMLRVDKEIRHAIVTRASEEQILNLAAQQPQFETLPQAGARLAAMGYTTLEQARKLAGEEAVSPSVKRLGEALADIRAATFEQVFDALAYQVELKKEGRVKLLGQIMLERGHCSIDELVEGLGRSAGAVRLTLPFVRSGRIKSAEFERCSQIWRNGAGTVNLFELLLQEQLITSKEIYEATRIAVSSHAGARQHGVGAIA